MKICRCAIDEEKRWTVIGRGYKQQHNRSAVSGRNEKASNVNARSPVGGRCSIVKGEGGTFRASGLRLWYRTGHERGYF